MTLFTGLTIYFSGADSEFIFSFNLFKIKRKFIFFINSFAIFVRQ